MSTSTRRHFAFGVMLS